MDIIRFYESKYGQNAKIPLEAFPLWDMRSKAELNKITFGKFEKISDYSDKQMYCICEIAELLYSQSEIEGISSENNDGYSVSYKDINIKQKIKEIANLYLDNDLLYRGY